MTEWIPVEKYFITIERRLSSVSDPPEKLITLIPSAAYTGLVNRIDLAFSDYAATTLGELSAGVGASNMIRAYARAGDFRDIYHILQSETSLTFFYDLPFGVDLPTSPVTTSIPLEVWAFPSSAGV